MRYLSLDIETTGLRLGIDQVLMISGVVDDTDFYYDKAVDELPHFTCFIGPSDEGIIGQPKALVMNNWILKIIAGLDPHPWPIYDRYQVEREMNNFLDLHFHDKLTVAGKNAAGFDIPFLESLFGNGHDSHECAVVSRFRHRVIDVGSVMVNWNLDCLPSLPEAKATAGLEPFVAHNAYDDACDVIRVLRTTYRRSNA